MSRQVGDLYQNSNIQQNFYYGYAKPLEDARTEGVVTSLKDSNDYQDVKSSKEDLNSFRGFFELSKKDSEPIVSPPEQYLTINTIQFGSNKWKFNLDDDITKWMPIEDQNFLNKVENKETAFYQGDVLRCLIQSKSSLKDDKPHKDYIILEVIEHKPAKRSVPINFDDGV